jgi:TonB family protein
MSRANLLRSSSKWHFAILRVLSIGSLLATSAPTSAQTYENSARGLNEQIENLLAARRENRPEAIREALRSFRLQNSEAWFRSTFEDPVGKWFARWYDEKADSLLAGLQTAFDSAVASQVTDVKVWRFEKACDEKAGEDWYPVLLVRRDKEPLYVVNLNRDGSTRASLWFFAHAEGGFRYLGALPFEVGSENAFSVGPSAPKIPTDPVTGKPDLEGVETPHLKRSVMPVYTYRARMARLEGTVVLWSEIDEAGKVVNLRLLRGHCWLVESALKAVKQWKYSPCKKNGKPMRVQLIVRVEMALTR